MSITAGLDIEFELPVNSLELICDLLKLGWSYNDQDRINYLPLGDGDMYNWTRTDLSNWSQVADIIKNKIKENELVGICLTWKESMDGCIFLFPQDAAEMWMALSINRQTLEGTTDTDFKWYEDKIVKPLIDHGYKIKSVKRSQDGNDVSISQA